MFDSRLRFLGPQVASLRAQVRGGGTVGFFFLLAPKIVFLFAFLHSTGCGEILAHRLVLVQAVKYKSLYKRISACCCCD
jgi:hypothetical protein